MNSDFYITSFSKTDNTLSVFLPLFTEIDKRLQTGSVIIAIEGASASGKTTLSEILRKIYGCTVLHTDDFFLRPEQRTPERYAQPGGNIDYERFIEEVLIPLKNGKIINYRRFDCSEMKIQEPIRIQPEKLTVIEGAYSMHPDFSDYYDYSVFLDIDSGLQKKRILGRNPSQAAELFFNKWIPLENKYFLFTDARNRCDLCIHITE